MSYSSKVVRYKRKEMKVGDQIVLIDDIQNGLIKLKALEEGRIIYLQNQVEATVWFRHLGNYYSEPISKALQIDTSYNKNGRLDGITVELKRESFAIKHQYNQDFDELVIDEDKAITIPFFKRIEEYRMPSNRQVNVGGGKFETVYQYYLNDIKTTVSDSFEEWVSANTKQRKISKREKENGEFPEEWDTCLTESSNDLFYKKKHELELEFAKATGVYCEFRGGLIFND